MKPYAMRTRLTLEFIQHDDGSVTMSAELRNNRESVDGSPSVFPILQERLKGDDVIRQARLELVSVLATWQHRNGLWDRVRS